MTDKTTSWLMWVGEGYYPTIQSYCEEAEKQGISKRLPNAHVGSALMQPGNVVFLAHDEGEHEECDACLDAELCPECEGTGRNLFRGKDRGECPDCLGAGKVLRGTGGTVLLDGHRTPYREYIRLCRMPHSFKRDEHSIEEVMPCDQCCGHGFLPVGKVFGLFMPSELQYVLRPEDDATVKEHFEKLGIKTITMSEVALELPRGCGKRKPGGMYAVTTPSASHPSVLELVHEMVRAGKLDPEGVDVKGSFARFLNPVEVRMPRFRGIKHWEPEGLAVEEAGMIIDSMVA